MSQKRDLLSDIVSQKRDLLSDCQWGGRTDRRTDGVTMMGEGLSCSVQLKILDTFSKILTQSSSPLVVDDSSEELWRLLVLPGDV